MTKNNPLTVKYSFFLNQTKEANCYFAMPEMHKRSSYLKISTFKSLWFKQDSNYSSTIFIIEKQSQISMKFLKYKGSSI
jgi:hypothetical protein